jgi:hypothetical protein
MIKYLAVVVLSAGLIGCPSRRYFNIPQTEEAHWCLNYCIEDQLRCVDKARIGSQCQKWADDCLAGCPGAVQVSYEQWVGDGGT